MHNLTKKTRRGFFQVQHRFTDILKRQGDWLAESLYSHLAGQASWQARVVSFCGGPVKLEVGQLVTTQEVLAKYYNKGRQAIRSALARLKALGAITTKSSRYFTVFTVVPEEAAEATGRITGWQPAEIPVFEDTYPERDPPEKPAEKPPLIDGEETRKTNPLNPPPLSVARVIEPAAAGEAEELLQLAQNRLNRFASQREREAFSGHLAAWYASGRTRAQLEGDIARLVANPAALRTTASVNRVFHVDKALSDPAVATWTREAVSLLADQARRGNDEVACLVAEWRHLFTAQELEAFALSQRRKAAG